MAHPVSNRQGLPWASQLEPLMERFLSCLEFPKEKIHGGMDEPSSTILQKRLKIKLLEFKKVEDYANAFFQSNLDPTLHIYLAKAYLELGELDRVRQFLPKAYFYLAQESIRNNQLNKALTLLPQIKDGFCQDIARGNLIAKLCEQGNFKIANEEVNLINNELFRAEVISRILKSEQKHNKKSRLF